MAKDNIQVPFGYEPHSDERRGSLIVYDDFSEARAEELVVIFRLAEEKKFSRIIFYPIHEETANRMGIAGLEPYHRRVKLLQAALVEAEQMARPSVEIALDAWEGKRKKYTPVETALAFLTEKNKGPHFVWMTEQIAAKWAGFASFPEWIRKLRLIIAPPYAGGSLPPALKDYKSRWEYAR